MGLCYLQVVLVCGLTLPVSEPPSGITAVSNTSTLHHSVGTVAKGRGHSETTSVVPGARGLHQVGPALNLADFVMQSVQLP